MPISKLLSISLRFHLFQLTGTLHGHSFACACRPLTNRRAAPKVANFQAAQCLVNGRQAQAKACMCRWPVRRNSALYHMLSILLVLLLFLLFMLGTTALTLMNYYRRLKKWMMSIFLFLCVTGWSPDARTCPLWEINVHRP